MTMAVAENTGIPSATANLKLRAERLICTEIEFIPNREFAAEGLKPRDPLDQLISQAASTVPSDLPAHFRQLCGTGLLSQEEESLLFREMNLLKFQANVLRSRLDPSRATEEEIRGIESRLAQARAIRDHLIQANMRLVISIVKKFVTPQQSFEELLSDGIVTLMQAVEKFDYDRGFRFSTYAYRSIARNAYRTVTAARKEEARFTRDAEAWAFEQDDKSSAMTDHVWSNLRNILAFMLGRLDPRERLIIRSRYALGSHRKVRTFQYLADRLGVSKERVRQLEQRAVGKLQAMAAEQELDDIFGAAMV